jgi:hypothetical protein
MMLISIKTQMVNQSSMMENKDVIVNLPWKNGLICVDSMVRNVIVQMGKFYMVWWEIQTLKKCLNFLLLWNMGIP